MCQIKAMVKYFISTFVEEKLSSMFFIVVLF